MHRLKTVAEASEDWEIMRLYQANCANMERSGVGPVIHDYLMCRVGVSQLHKQRRCQFSTHTITDALREKHIDTNSHVQGVIGAFPPTNCGRSRSIAFRDGGMIMAAWPSARPSVTTGSMSTWVEQKCGPEMHYKV